MEADLAAFGAALESNLRPRSREWLRKELGVSPQLISGYINGLYKPKPDRVLRMEELLGLPSGTLSRLLGYVPVEAAAPVSSVPDAIRRDPSLDADARRYLLAVYEVATRSRRSPRK